MPAKVKIKSNFKGLDKLQKDFKEINDKIVKLGIFASDGARSDGGLTNVEIGAKHEFGVISEGVPRRSFLKDPVELKRKELLEKIQKIIRSNIEEGNINKILELVGIVGESIIQEAFETGGYGTWQPISDYTASKKGSSQILIDTSQLRRAVISKVDKRN